MFKLRSPTTRPLAARLAGWRPHLDRMRTWLGSGCPQRQRRSGAGVDLFSVAMAGMVPDTHAGARHCALLDSGICDEHCIRAN